MNDDLVDPYIDRDPETEDLVWDGLCLNEVMEVLAYHRDLLVDIRDIDPDCFDAIHQTARITNRWCRIKKLWRSDSYVNFIGVYGDGSEAYREVRIGYPWLVKKTPSEVETEPPEDYDERYDREDMPSHRWRLL